jgi:hypothetical protein
MLDQSRAFLDAFQGDYDTFISHKEFDEMAGLKSPKLSEISTQAELDTAFKRHTLLRLRVIEEVRSDLLENRQMLMVSVHGQGFRIVLPEQQTLTVLEKGARELSRTFNKMGRGLAHVNRNLLDASQKAENDIARTRVDGLRGIVSKKSLVGQKRLKHKENDHE